MSTEQLSDGDRYVHGQRFVMLLPSSQAGARALHVLDFNVRRAFDVDEGVNADANDANACEPHHADEDADLSRTKTTLARVDYPTRIVMPNIFVDAVESGLPYREARRDVRDEYSGIMIDDERLVGLKVRGCRRAW